VDRLRKLSIRMVFLFTCLASPLRAQQQAGSPAGPIRVKVVVVSMFEVGEDTGDTPGEYQLWVEREHLDQILPLPAGYHHVRMNKDGVLGMLTGVATSKAYWVIAGIAGGDPADVSLGSAVWANHVIDGEIAYEIDAREIPPDWPTGFAPLGKSRPYEQPVASELDGHVYTLNQDLVTWAFQLTKNVPLADSEALRVARAQYTGFPNAIKPPFVTRGDNLSTSTFWLGKRMDEWANAWTSYYTGGKGNYMVSAMEDSGTMQALTFLNQAGRADLNRVLVLRTVSDYDREPPGMTPAESLQSMSDWKYPAFIPALEAAERVGDKIVRDVVDHWSERESTIPHAPQ
jgi:purine nucleoside permease